MSYIQDQYESAAFLCKGSTCVRAVRENLYKEHFQHQQKKVVHPKLTALYANMAEWLSKEKLKDPEGEPKVEASNFMFVLVIPREMTFKVRSKSVMTLQHVHGVL